MRIALPLTVSLFCLLAGGCGQKGPLFLPTESPTQSAPAERAPEAAPADTQPQLPPQSKPSQS